MENGMKRVTIKDVAAAAGVSPTAVSRVFTNTAGSSHTMRQKVLETAKTLGYRPSMLAKGLTGERTNLITLVTGRMADPFDALFLEKISAALTRRGMQLLLVPASGQNDTDSGFLHALDYQSDAVIVSAGTMSLEHSAACVRNGLPVILMGRVVRQAGVDCVVANNNDGARMAAELLLRTGCSGFAYLGRGGATYSDKERLEGFTRTLAQAGYCATECAIESPIGDTTIFQSAVTLLSCAERPDGIFCSCDAIAFGVIEAARALGIRVPDELAIIGFNNVPQASWRCFDLTTIELSADACITKGLELLEQRLANPGRPSQICRIPVTLQARSTTRIAPHTAK